MSKVEILRLDSVTTNDTTATATINTNFQNIQNVIETLLSRTGAEPNYMDAVLDMNSCRIINTADPVGDFDVVNLKYLKTFTADIESKVAVVEAAADAAMEKAQNAAASATSAALDAASAQGSARQAAADAAISAQAAIDISGYLTDPNLVAVGTDLRLGDNSLIKQVSEMDTAAILQAGEDAVQAAQDAEDAKDDAIDAKNDAEAAAAAIQDLDFAVDLSYTSNTLQLIDQNGDPLGTAQAIDALPSQTGQSGKFLTTDGSDASWATVSISSTLAGLTDVTLTSPTNGQVLSYNSGDQEWQNTTQYAMVITDYTA
jgi:hypothetical protein